MEAVETKREGKPGKETAQALTSVAWHALFAREYTKALTVSDRAHALLPDIARSRPSWISARVRSHYRTGLDRPFGSPVFACAGKTDPPFRLILSQTSAGSCRITSSLAS